MQTSSIKGLYDSTIKLRGKYVVRPFIKFYTVSQTVHYDSTGLQAALNTTIKYGSAVNVLKALK
jgi:hypothetical protein